jgi:WD40 repeat protein
LVAPRDEFLLAVGYRGQAYAAPLDGSPARKLEGLSEDRVLTAAAVSPSGRRVATASSFGAGERKLGVWDLETGERWLFNLPEASTAGGWGGAVNGVHFMDETTLLTAGDGGVRRWNIETGGHTLIWATEPGFDADIAVNAGGRTALAKRSLLDSVTCIPVDLLDLTTGAAEPLPSFGECFPMGPVIDVSGPLAATTDVEGVVRVGRLSGGEPHLLVGHEGTVASVAISPDLRWVATMGQDSTLRLWPIPDLDKPPLHTLPCEELLAKLRSLTNLRAVREPEAPDGWKIELGPFPGWKEVPAW